MPHLICDPPAPEDNVKYYTVVSYVSEQDPTIRDNITQPAEADGSIRLDVSDWAPDDYFVRVAACNDWGCSLTVPFGFIIPESPKAPSGIQLLFS